MSVTPEAFDERCKEFRRIYYPKRMYWQLQGVCAAYGLNLQLLRGGLEVAELSDQRRSLVIYVNKTRAGNEHLRVRTPFNPPNEMEAKVIYTLMDDLGIKIKNAASFRREFAS
jgi:hypothetical protein